MAKPIKTYSLPLSILTESLEYRFDAGHFSPDLLNALNTLEQSGLELERLGDIVEHVNLPGRFKRIYVESADGLPFLQGSHVVHFQPAESQVSLPGIPSKHQLNRNKSWLVARHTVRNCWQSDSVPAGMGRMGSFRAHYPNQFQTK